MQEVQSVEALYRADAERLWRALYAFVGDGDIASDAVAEAYAQVLHRGSGQSVAECGSWWPATRSAIIAGRCY